MTFSIIARDSSGALGQAVTSSSPAVAARCIHLRGNTGAVSSQNITDPRYGKTLLDALANNTTADDAIQTLKESDPTIEYRQITVLPLSGEATAFSGENTLGVHHSVVGSDYVVAGNMLSSPSVIDAMAKAFEESEGELELRLMQALAAGNQAGGEAGPVHSAGLAVTRSTGWNETDLRVDWSESPLEDLDELLKIWMEQRDDYVTRAFSPQTSPSYGVPGNE